jgi:hypothetical protein
MKGILEYFAAFLLGAASGLESATPSEVGAVPADALRAGAPLKSVSGGGRESNSRIAVDCPKPQPVGLPGVPAEVIPPPNPSGPVITSQPVSQSVLASRHVFLSVTAAGTPPLNCQWQSNRVNLLNATNQVLCVRAVAPSNAPEYQVLVSNALGSVTSVVARVTVSGPAQGQRPDPPGDLRVVGAAQ